MAHLVNPCPCCSRKEYDICCKPFHEGKSPDNALQLMRSRYSAYALHLPDYLVATTHPANPRYEKDVVSWKQKISQFAQNTSFDRLEILDFREKNSSATVTFTAHLSQNGQDATFTEKSSFEKLHGKWLYRKGTILYRNTDF